jgi:hypothetical protein
MDEKMKGTPMEKPSTTSPKPKNRKFDLLFENYGLEFISSSSSLISTEGLNGPQSGSSAPQKISSSSLSSSSSMDIEYEGEEEREEGDEETSNSLFSSMDSKQLFKIAFTNYRLTVTDGIPVPIPGFDFLLIGSVGSAYNLESLQNAGITHILCLSEVIKMRFTDHFIYKRLILNDKANFSLLPFLHEAFDFMNEARNFQTATDGEKVSHDGSSNEGVDRDIKHGKVLVHCYQGISRSAAICCAYMIIYGGMTRDDALSRIKSVRATIQPNSGFMELLKQLEQQRVNYPAYCYADNMKEGGMLVEGFCDEKEGTSPLSSSSQQLQSTSNHNSDDDESETTDTEEDS